MDKDNLVGKKIKAVPVEDPNIGIDLDDTFQEDIFDAIEVSQLDSSALENFSNVAQTREEIYSAIDVMAQDNKVSAILETYTDYVTETNDNGKIVWCESKDGDIGKYVTFLLESLNVDKNIYAWAYKLAKEGDLYWEMFTESEFEQDLFAEKYKDDQDTVSQSKRTRLNESQELKENIYVNVEDSRDHYVHYIEAVANPGEMFELTKFGKTMGFSKAPINVTNNLTVNNMNSYNQFFHNYKYRRKDVSIFSATDYVHATLEDNSSRRTEKMNIFLTDEDYEKETNNNEYTIKRGQSLLYNVFKI